jgi:hypothetical protein
MLSTELECFRQSWNAFDRVGIPLYRVGMLSTELGYLCTELQCFLQGSNAFYRVGMLATVLEFCLQCWKAVYRVAMLTTELEYLCTGCECFLQG